MGESRHRLFFKRIFLATPRQRVSDQVWRLSSTDRQQASASAPRTFNPLEDRPAIVTECATDRYPEFRKAFYEKLVPTMKRWGKTPIITSHDN